ncbi:unnamed protein product, partial [Owenia fusiformis]
MATSSNESKSDNKAYGVILTADTEDDPINDSSVCLGCIILNSNQLGRLTLNDIRDKIAQQLSDVPVQFCFLTKQGWQVTPSQEDMLLASSTIITEDKSILIKKFYDKARVGVRLNHVNRSVHSEGSHSKVCGFIFADHSEPLHCTRNALLEQLPSIFSNEQNSEFVFKDRNGWPITSDQEINFTVLDILAGAYISLQVFSTDRDLPMISEVQDAVDSTQVSRPSQLELPPPPSPKRPRFYMPKALTFRSAKDLEREVSISSTDSSGTSGGTLSVTSSANTPQLKEIMISYVRCEAAEHALMLKKLLVKLNFSVFLDVHEIKLGVDWQDYLNYAVSNCEVFVPLVTNRYGETQWTNREVKLADVLHKYILPINFLEEWPPKCLAIQFATTQFIPWSSGKHKEPKLQGELENSSDAMAPNQECLEVVAKEIAQHVKNYKVNQLKTALKANAPPLLTPNEEKIIPPPGTPLMGPCSADGLFAPRNSLASSTDSVDSVRHTYKIVLSMHPRQREFGQRLRQELEQDGCEVWCSTDISATASSMELADTPDSSQTMSPAVSSELRVEDSGMCPLLLKRSGSICSDNSEADELKWIRQTFQEKVDKACVVIILLSKAFAGSKMCRQQVFYCEHRKRMIPLKYEDFPMPYWMAMLIGTDSFEDVQSEGFIDSLRARIRMSPMRTLSQTDMDQAIAKVQESLPSRGCIYISGGTKFYNKTSEDICKAIGEHLAKVEDVTLVTGGFFGVGDCVGRSFHTSHENDPPPMFHILPHKDCKVPQIVVEGDKFRVIGEDDPISSEQLDRRHQGHQNEDRQFQKLDYGTTVFAGNSVRQRETIVARLFNICILVE